MLWCIDFLVLLWLWKAFILWKLSLLSLLNLRTFWNRHGRGLCHDFLLFFLCFLNLFDWFFTIFPCFRLKLDLFCPLFTFSWTLDTDNLWFLLLSWNNLDILLFFLLIYFTGSFIFYQWKVLNLYCCLWFLLENWVSCRLFDFFSYLCAWFKLLLLYFQRPVLELFLIDCLIIDPRTFPIFLCRHCFFLQLRLHLFCETFGSLFLLMSFNS